MGVCVCARDSSRFVSGNMCRNQRATLACPYASILAPFYIGPCFCPSRKTPAKFYYQSRLYSAVGTEHDMTKIADPTSTVCNLTSAVQSGMCILSWQSFNFHSWATASEFTHYPHAGDDPSDGHESQGDVADIIADHTTIQPLLMMLWVLGSATKAAEASRTPLTATSAQGIFLQHPSQPRGMAFFSAGPSLQHSISVTGHGAFPAGPSLQQ